MKKVKCIIVSMLVFMGFMLVPRSVFAKSVCLGTITYSKKDFTSAYNSFMESNYSNEWKSIDYYADRCTFPYFYWDYSEYFPEYDSIENISSIYSSANPNICKLGHNSGPDVEAIPVSPGTTRIYAYYEGIGEKNSTLYTINDNFYYNIVVGADFLNAYNAAYNKRKTSVNTFYYGDSAIRGKSVSGAAVSVKIGKKNLKAKVINGKFKIKKVPLVKNGTTLSINFSKNGVKWTEKVKVEFADSWITLPKTYANATKITIKLKRVDREDVLTLKIGNNKYTKKFKSLKKNTKVTFILKRTTAGQKIVAELKNKFKQRISYENDYVWLTNTIKVGMTKSQALLVPRWRKSNRLEIFHSAYGDTWNYDTNGDGYADSWLVFDTSGRVSNYQY